MLELDIHTHSIASGHVSTATILDMVRSAAEKRLKLIGISDHAPATQDSCKEGYFRSLKITPRKRLGIEVMYGVELNILNKNGDVDLPDSILKDLDYAIASMHTQNILPGTKEENTNTYLNVIKNPYVTIIGHADDTQYPVDYEILVKAAVENQVLLEINNVSLIPDSYRGNALPNTLEILKYCKKYNHPVIFSSDSHGAEDVGDFHYALLAMHRAEFPRLLVLNDDMEKFKAFIAKRKSIKQNQIRHF